MACRVSNGKAGGHFCTKRKVKNVMNLKETNELLSFMKFFSKDN